MLLNIYLGSVAISFAIRNIFFTACKKRLKRKGYEYKNDKDSFLEKNFRFVFGVFRDCIPIYNIATTLLILCKGEKLYDEAEEQLLENGEIYMPIEQKTETESDAKNFESEKTNTCTESIKKSSTQKKYEEMTKDEKIAFLHQERERLIAESTPEVDKPFILNKTQK